MKTFWIVFILALLFVIGSASALRYFDNKNLPPARRAEKKDIDKSED